MSNSLSSLVSKKKMTRHGLVHIVAHTATLAGIMAAFIFLPWLEVEPKQAAPPVMSFKGSGFALASGSFTSAEWQVAEPAAKGSRPLFANWESYVVLLKKADDGDDGVLQAEVRDRWLDEQSPPLLLFGNKDLFESDAVSLADWTGMASRGRWWLLAAVLFILVGGYSFRAITHGNRIGVVAAIVAIASLAPIATMAILVPSTNLGEDIVRGRQVYICSNLAASMNVGSAFAEDASATGLVRIKPKPLTSDQKRKAAAEFDRQYEGRMGVGAMAIIALAGLGAVVLCVNAISEARSRRVQAQQPD